LTIPLEERQILRFTTKDGLLAEVESDGTGTAVARGCAAAANGHRVATLAAPALRPIANETELATARSAWRR
jgi:hypothetical protein